MGKKIRRVISEDDYKKDFETLGKKEIYSGMTLEKFYDEYVRKQCGKIFCWNEMMAWEKEGFQLMGKNGKMEKHNAPTWWIKMKEEGKPKPFTVTWLARQAGMDRGTFVRRVLPLLRRYDELRSQKYGINGGLLERLKD